MTYYKNESPVAGPNEQKLIIEVWTTPDVNDIDWNTANVKIDIKVSTYQAKYSGDNQVFNRTSGGWSGSTSYYMPASANTTVVIATETKYVTPQVGRATAVSYAGNISGHYSVGTGFNAAVNFSIGAKPYPASRPTLGASTFDMGTNVLINMNRINSNFTHIVRWEFNGGSGTIATNVGVSTTWTFPVATLAPRIPNATQGVGTVYVDTYNGGTKIGTDSVEFTARIPASVVPTVDTTSVGDSSVQNIIGAGIFVKGLSTFQVQLIGCRGIWASTIKKQEVTIGSATHNLTQPSGDMTTSMLKSIPVTVVGSVAVVGKVTDSRGRVGTKTTTVTVVDYRLPNPTGFTVQRADSAGTVDILGTYAKITSVGSTSSIVNVTERNELSYQIDYRQVGTTPWTTLKAKTTISGLNLNVVETLGNGQFSAVNSYEFRLTIFDKFNNVGITSVVGTSQVTLSLNKTGIGIGKVWQKGAIDAKGKIYATDNIESDVDIKATGDLWGSGLHVTANGFIDGNLTVGGNIDGVPNLAQVVFNASMNAASTTINVDLPAGVFTGTPYVYVNLTYPMSTVLIARYTPTGSSATKAVIDVRTANGAVFNGGFGGSILAVQ